MKKLLSLILVVVMLISAVPFAVSAQTNELTYTFSGTNADDAGYAEGTITFTAETDGTYYIYWADDEKALEKFFEIASFTLTAGESGSFKFSEQVAIPADAECVIVTTQSCCDTATVASAIAKVDIPDAKKLVDSSSQRQYRYAALSDIHIDVQHGTSAGYYEYSTAHWENTLKDCVDREVDFIISAGDQVTNAQGPALEWLTYQQILAESDYVNPIYEADGNHEPRGTVNAGCDEACANEEYSLGTGLDKDATSIVEGKDYYEVTEPNTGDHFIFMSEVNAHPGENDNFSTEQLDWLEGLLAKYKGDGKKIFLIQHALLQGYGAGDDVDDPGYQGGIRMAHAETGEEFPNNQRFKAILEANKEIIWYSGHTHLDLVENKNYSSENGASCHMVHIPSACNTTRFTRDANGYKVLGSSTDYTFYDDATQGYFVDVFEDATVLYGTNLYYNKVYPAYTYLIEEGEPETRPTQEPTIRPTLPPIEGGKTVYCVNSASWETVCAYAWVDGGAQMAWPGNPMTKTGQTVNSYDVYEIQLEPEYDKVIFNNNNKGSQTADLTLTEGQYFDVKTGAWYASLEEIPASDPLATDRYLVGEFNSWSTVSDEFKLKNAGDSTAYVTMNLAANTTYQFKVVREGTWTSCATPITGDVSGLTFSKSTSANATITTTYAGEYVFSFGMNSSQLGVVYPTSTPTEPVTVPTEPQTQPTEPEKTIMYGDVDGNGDISIMDATLVQRAVAKMVVLTEDENKRALVNGNENLSVMDATCIQRYIAKAIEKFPVETAKAKGVATTSAEALTSEELFTKATEYLSYYFQYASYDTYQALKKTVYKYKDTDTTALSAEAQTEITNAISAFDALREKVHQQTVYFTDAKAFSNIRAYYFNSANSKEVDAWPGQVASYVRTNSYGQNVYAITLNFSKFDTIVFNGGSNKTVDIALDGCSGKLYYTDTQDTTTLAWNVGESVFKQMWYGEKQDEIEDDVLEDLTIYFTDALSWGTVKCYYWLGSKNNTWPGEDMEFVRNNSQGQAIYKMTVPAGASAVFNNGSGTQSVDVTGLADGYGYYLTSLSGGKYLFETYKYGE